MCGKIPKVREIGEKMRQIMDVTERVERTGDPREPFAFTYEGAALLLEMALEDVVPSGEFGDCECVLWGEFRRILRNHGLQDKYKER
jgi:hypothetical protein